MKRESRRSVIISILIALVVHLVLLVALFLSMYRMYLHEMHDPEEITVLTQAGSAGTSVTLYQPPVQTVSQSSGTEAESHAPYEPIALPQLAPDVEKTVTPVKIPPVLASEPGAQYAEKADLQEVEREVYAQQIRPKKGQTSPKKRRKMAIAKLKELSLVQPSHDTKPVLLQGDRGFVCHTNVHDIVYQRYVRKIIQMMAAAINAERLRVLIDESLSCSTTLFVKVQRDGKMVDFYFEYAHPTLRQLERAAQPVVQASWFYLPIPDSIPEDFIVMPLQVRVECRRGFDTYHFYFNE
jgi:hypothetical protein